MQNSLISKEEKLKEYNDEPVYYCRHCLSLVIKNVPKLDDSDYCDSCGSTDVGICSIEEWENLYIKKYGHRFLDSY